MGGYLDASVLLAILIDEEASPRVDQFIESRETSFTVSEFAAAEVASGISRRVRAGSIDLDAAVHALSRFDAWRAASAADRAVHDSDVRLASIYVRRFETYLRTPDALHLAICHRAGLPLVTLDVRLAAVAEPLGVRAIVP